MGEHHGPSPEAIAQLAALRADMETLGATGKFPDGKLTQDDEGELRFALVRKDGQVIMHFGKPTAWVGMPADLAEHLAEGILKHVRDIREGR